MIFVSQISKQQQTGPLFVVFFYYQDFEGDHQPGWWWEEKTTLDFVAEVWENLKLKYHWNSPVTI